MKRKKFDVRVYGGQGILVGETILDSKIDSIRGVSVTTVAQAKEYADSYLIGPSSQGKYAVVEERLPRRRFHVEVYNSKDNTKVAGVTLNSEWDSVNGSAVRTVAQARKYAALNLVDNGDQYVTVNGKRAR